MLIPITLLVTCGINLQAITTPYDSCFGRVEYNMRKASVLWAYYLVYPWSKDNAREFNGKGLASRARPCLQDLLARMDRPIVANIAKGDMNPQIADEKDDLAAGIAFWTLEWKSDATQGGANWEMLRRKAEYFLLKASHEGDNVQQSFASLAYAYCPWRCTADGIGAMRIGVDGELTPIFLRADARPRMSIFRARLLDTYNRFRKSVPERALRAAHQLSWLGGGLDNDLEFERWRETIRSEFKDFESWYSYKPDG